MAELEMWTIYERPLDYPHGYIARRWIVRAGVLAATQQTMASPMFLPLQQTLSMQLGGNPVWLPRDDSDEPHIVGTWIR